jgi:hypothetical protein
MFQLVVYVEKIGALYDIDFICCEVSQFVVVY